LDKAKAKGVDIVLPIDHIVCDNVDDPIDIRTTTDENIDAGYFGVDIGPKTIDLFKKKLNEARTIVWNGPMGIFENNVFANGTKKMAEMIANSSAISVVGGGDSAAAVKKFGVEDRFSHVSTGGGASLEYLEGKTLPGIAALADKD
jgi:3-phosphoglycerate kinase